MSALIEYVTINGEQTRVRRPFAVPEHFEDLSGPATGALTLPTRLDWTPRHSYSLADDREVRSAYTQILQASINPADLTEYLNPQLLKRIWNRMRLPVALRTEWESRFPTLRGQEGTAQRSRPDS